MCDSQQTTMRVLPFEKKEKQGIIFIGIQACGKTTFYHRMLSEDNYVHISLDDLHTRNREKQELDRCLESGCSFVIDNTNPETSDRTAYIQMAKEYGYHIIGLFFQSQVKECVRRNEERGGKVPSKAIASTSNKLQMPSTRKKVVFIDEMPWIDSLRSNFTEAFENFWNGWAARRKDIMFIASGSATSWMIDNLVENQGGLHARITCQIYLRPFTLNETEQYLQGRGCLWDRFQIAQCYMFFGGVPFYLSLLDTKDSLAQNVDRLCFARGGALRLEFDELYNALFTNADRYVDIARLLAERRSGMTSSEIAKATLIDGKRLAKMLNNLERCDFIMKFRYYGKNSNDVIYKLTDFYTLFYIKYIEIYKDSYDEQWWQHHLASHSVESWQGLTFELLCLMHIRQIRQALNIGGVATEVSAWFDQADKKKAVRGSQIDLIIERADRIIHLCEMKFSQGEYRITADYEEKLRNRMALFQEKTKNKMTLVHTFITTFGVANGKHSSLVHSEVTLDGLFIA